MKFLRNYLVVILLYCAADSLATEMIFVTSTDGYLRAKNLSHGVEKWRAYVGTKYLYEAASADGLIFVGTDNEKLYALRENNGRIDWGCKIDGCVINSPIVASDYNLVFVSTDKGYLYAVRITTGRIKWEASVGKRITVHPKRATTELICVGGEDGTIYGFDIETGRIKSTY